MRILPFLLLLTLATPAPAQSAEGDTTGHLYAGAAFFFENMLKVSTGGSGNRSLLGTAYFPELLVGYRFGSWFPVLGITLFGSESGEGNKRSGVIRLQMPYVFPRPEDSAWEWKLGPGLLLHRIYGEGGITKLGNGAGTKNYYTPEENRMLRLWYLTGGAAYLHEQWRYDFDLIVTGLLSTRRAFSFGFGVGYVF